MFNFLRLVNEYKKNTKKENIEIILENKNDIDLLDSKIGGIPYIPKNFIFYKSEYNNFLTFFAQINLKDLPKNNILGLNEGILSFWIDANSYSYGAFFEHNNFNNYKVIYFENIDKTVNENFVLSQLNKKNFKEIDFITRPLKINFKNNFSYLSPLDYKYENYIIELLKKYKINQLNEKQEDLFYNINKDMSKIGYNPNFVQGDFRQDTKFFNYEINLLQIVSDKNINIGDGGILHFFINKKDLEKKDFSKVLFNWDCY